MNNDLRSINILSEQMVTKGIYTYREIKYKGICPIH